MDKLGGESAFVLMGLLGASIMPHNFYLHSSIVQREQQSEDLTKEAACYKHLFVTVCIFSCVFLLNYALMNLAANVFYSSGLVVFTFQDALSLFDQNARKLTMNTFLYSLGLEKYVINFQAEEIDMAVLKQMGDRDLKKLGLPMGPRKKILLSLIPPARRPSA